MNHHLYLLLAALLVSSVSESAARTIRFRTVCFEFAPGEREVTASGDPKLKNTATVVLGRRLDSTQHEIEVAATTVVLGKLVLNADQQPSIEPMAVANLPDKGRHFLFLLLPSGRQSGEVYRCLVLEDGTDDFPAGGFRWVNLSPRKLRFAIGAESFVLPPGAIEMRKQIRGTGPGGRVPYVAQCQGGEVWNRLSSGFWTCHQHTRSLQVAFLDPRSGRVRMRGYDDTLPVALEQRAREAAADRN